MAVHPIYINGGYTIVEEHNNGIGVALMLDMQLVPLIWLQVEKKQQCLVLIDL